MKTFLKAALAATMLAGVSTTAQAQVNIVGTTSGCFYLTTSPATCSSNVFGGLTFTGGSFSITPASPGAEYQLNTLNDYLGTFVLASNTNTNFGDPLRFRLSITFTSPTIPGLTSFSADFDGQTTVNSNDDQLDIDFDNNYVNLDYTGAGYSQFRINVNDIENLERDDANGQMLTGKIKCWEQGDDDDGDINTCKPPAEGSVGTTAVTTPEPSTYALMAAGLAAVGFVGRRRRNNA